MVAMEMKFRVKILAVAFCMRLILIALLMTFCAMSTYAEEPDTLVRHGIDDNRTEITALTLEWATSVKKLAANWDLRKTNETKIRKLLPEAKRLEIELQEIEAQRSEQEAQCQGGTYTTQAEVDAANSRCEASAKPLEKRVEIYSIAAEKLIAYKTAIENSEKLRLAEAGPLVARHKEIVKRLAVLGKPTSVNVPEDDPRDSLSPIRDVPKQDVTRLGDKVASLVMDAIRGGPP